VARIAIAAAAGLLAGCASLSDWIAPPTDRVMPEIHVDRLYEEMYPRYVELCAVSQFRPKDGRPGGIPGHAVLYLKGACRDESSPYPRLKACDGAAPTDHGVGVSVNRWFKNVNWVATPGRLLFFRGAVPPERVLDAEEVDRAAKLAIELGMYGGIELHEYPTEAPERSIEDFVKRESLGTDFALNFGRTAHCSRVPVTASMLESAIAYLNELNDAYARTEAVYEWSGFSDNCAHTVHNALAAAGIWKPEAVHATKVRQLLDLAVPANEFVHLAERSNHLPIESFDSLYEDPAARSTLERHDWLPTTHGALVETYHVHQLNEVYESDYRLLGLESPFTHGLHKRADLLQTDARLTELHTNLIYFIERYRRVLAAEEEVRSHTAHLDSEYRDTLSRYYDWVRKQLADAEAKLARYMAVKTKAGDALE